MIDAYRLRNDLIDYFGTAKGENPAATIDLVQVENADLRGLLYIAKRAGFDIEDYVVECGED